MKQKINFLLGLIILSCFCSCATILNGTDVDVNVISTKPGRIVLNGDTSRQQSLSHTFIVKRADRVTITEVGDTAGKPLFIKPIHSFAYYLNFFITPYFIGAPIDLLVNRKTKKHLSYPKIYLDHQAPLGYYTDSSLPSQYKNVIKISPFTIFDGVNPAIDVAYERVLNKNFSLQARFSQMIDIKDESNRMKNLRGYKYGLGGRYFFKNNAPKGFYLAADYNHLKTNYNASLGFKTSQRNYYSENVLINKETHDININLGYQYVSNHFLADVYLGLGFKHKNIVHKNRQFPQDEQTWLNPLNFWQDGNREGKRIVLSMPLNVRLGYTF